MKGARTAVVIVGAGFAGLSAARRLAADKRFSVTLLEGNDRVGGRAKSVAFPGCPLEDLGCTWVYDTAQEGTENFIFRHAYENGHLKLSDSPSPKPALHLLSTGEEVRPADVRRYARLYHMIQQELEHRAVSGDWEFTIDPGKEWQEAEPLQPAEVAKLDYHDYVTRRFMKITESDPVNQAGPEVLKPHHILRHCLVTEGTIDGTQESKDVDILTYGEYDGEHGSILTAGGYQQIAKDLASQLPKKCIHFKKEVVSVQWTPPPATPESSGPPVLLQCADGSTYQADHVIMTASLGVLKQRCCPGASTSLFSPSLPDRKISAIQALGMGPVNKVLLQFPRPLAGNRASSLRLYWRDEELGFPENHPWATKLHFLRKLNDTHNIYEVWLTGDNAVAIESLKDEEVAEGISLVLERFLKEPIKRPKILRSSWCTDRLFRGSYSYNALGSSKLDREELGRPVDGSTHLQLLFAGEATHPSMFSTTNGAFDSGEREANRLIQYHNQKNN